MGNYLDVSKASDLKKRSDRILYRIFEIFPGFLSSFILISALLLSWLKPVWISIFIILFCIFYFFKTIYFGILQISAYRKMKKALSENWEKKLKKIKGWEKIYHLIIFPTYKEEKEIIETSLKALLRSSYPKEKMMVVLALEERAGEKHLKEISTYFKKFRKKFFKFLITVHPKDIPGEIAGKGSNVSYALGEAKRKIVDPLKIPYEKIIVSDFDIDSQIYPHYFHCLTYHFLKTKDPFRTSFQPIPVYHNNIYQAPAFSRVISTANTFWQMMQQSQPETLVTYSSHSFPFKTIIKVGYPHTVVSDDSRVFWKSFFYFDGNYKVCPLFYPLSMDSVLSFSLKRTIINQYRQQRRWAWGCIEIPYLLFNFIKNKKIPFLKKIFYSYNIIDGFLNWAVASLLIFFLGWLPLIFGGEKFNQLVLSYNLPRTLSFIMSLASIGLIFSAILNLSLLPPAKEKLKIKIFHFFQWFLLPLCLIIFGSLPALDAQLRLMFGKYMGFWVTEKVRKNKLR